jgi:uncharacterized iron-regulated membrane protein
MSFRLFRRGFYEIHLWLGIISGIVLFAICLSGTILVFQDEVRHLAEPAKYYVDVPKDSNALSVDELIAKVEAANHFTGTPLASKPAMKVAAITIPEKPNRTVTMNLASTEQGRDRGGRNQNMVYVNPYTGDIVGEGANVADPFFMSMMLLHRFLWMTGDWQWIGKMIVGITTIIFIVSCLSGIVLWLPGTWKAWKIGLRIRFRKGAWRFMYDLHNTVGFYLLIPSLILALTGLCWSFAWYRDAASYVLGDQVFKQRMQQPEKIEPMENSAQPLSVGEMIARQNKLTPGAGEIAVSIPQDSETAMVIRKGGTGFFSLNIKDKTQWDRYRGTVILVEHHGQRVEVERFSDKPFGAKIAVSIRAVHLGDITGMSSKIFFFVVCLFITSFPLTGAVLWIRKLIRARSVSRARSEPRPEGCEKPPPPH